MVSILFLIQGDELAELHLSNLFLLRLRPGRWHFKGTAKIRRTEKELHRQYTEAAKGVHMGLIMKGD